MSAIPLIRAFGYEIRVHVSWALVLAVIVVTVGSRVEASYPGTTTAVRWVIAGAIAVAVLVSVVIHELGHAVVARRVGLPPEPVIVYFFGAAASPATPAPRARDEIAVALGGPFVSLTLAAGLLAFAVGATALAGGALEVVSDIAIVVGALNLVLGLLNLLPAFPLDGGRVVRGLVWARSGDAATGLRAAAIAGRSIGLLLGALGVALILLVDPFDGLMVSLCGWFIMATASGLQRRARFEGSVSGLQVSEIMDREVQSIPPGLTLDTFASRVLDGTVSSSLPVVRGSDLVGIIGIPQLRRIRADRWATVRASDVMASGAGMPEVASETSMSVVLEALRRTGLDGLPVVDGGVLTGVVTRRGIADALRRRSAPGGPATV